MDIIHRVRYSTKGGHCYAKRYHPPLAAGQPAYHRTGGAAGRGNVSVQLYPQLLRQCAADHVPAVLLGDRSAENVYRRYRPERCRQPQSGAAAHGGTVFR